MKDSKVILNFRLIIHTVEMLSVTLNNPDRLKEIGKKPYINGVKLTKEGCKIVINANKLYDKEINTLTDFLAAVRQIQADLDILEWVFSRVDFAFDTTLKYDDIYKYSLYIICLLSESTGIKNAIDIQDINTKKKRALTLKSSVFEAQIYDKALESGNKHPYCRFEFRFKNIHGTDIYSITERLRQYINGLSKAIHSTEEKRINDLYALWTKENKSENANKVNTFSEFVRRYSNDIFTRDILKGLYTKIYSGNFENWLKWFRRNNRIEFISKTELESIIKEMKTVLNLYIEKV